MSKVIRRKALESSEKLTHNGNGWEGQRAKQNDRERQKLFEKCTDGVRSG